MTFLLRCVGSAALLQPLSKIYERSPLNFGTESTKKTVLKGDQRKKKNFIISTSITTERSLKRSRSTLIHFSLNPIFEEEKSRGFKILMPPDSNPIEMDSFEPWNDNKK